MKQPIWRKWLSYLVELHLESADSEVNPHLYVSLVQGRYQLSTANAVYSYGDLYGNFFKAFQQINFDKLTGDRVLVLGLGLASIPYMLENNFDQDYHYTLVELDESVVYLANKYVLDELRSPVSVISADAIGFTALCEETFDLICMDVFLDNKIPHSFEQRHFLKNLAALLAPGGLVLYNRLTVSNRDVRQTNEFYQDQFKAVFPRGGFLDVGANWILLNRMDYLK